MQIKKIINTFDFWIFSECSFCSCGFLCLKPIPFPLEKNLLILWHCVISLRNSPPSWYTAMFINFVCIIYSFIRMSKKYFSQRNALFGAKLVMWKLNCVFMLIIRSSQVALMVKTPPANAGRHKRHGFNSWVEKIPWRRAWQPIPVFLAWESHGSRGLAGYGPWDRKELDTTEAT